MYKFSAETLELFRIYQWSLGRHLDKITNTIDRAEIDIARACFAAKDAKRKSCEDCKESLASDGYVCASHYHDYINQGPNCCWTCYVQTVHKEQLGIILE